MALNGNSPKLTPRQRRTIAALLTARDAKSAAEIAGVGYRTLNRWLQDETFVLALREAEGQAIAEAVRGLIADLQTNLAVMRAVRDNQDSPEAVRLRAAQALDGSLLKWREAQNIEERLAELEAAIYGSNQKTRAT